MTETGSAAAPSTFGDAAAALAATPFFARLSPVALARLVPDLEERLVEPGGEVFHQGDPADGLYLIRAGTAAVSVLSEGEPQIVAVLEAPAYFGEMALLSDEPRSATVVALTPLSLWKLPRERFDALIEQYPDLPLRLAAEMTHRLAETTRQLSASRQELIQIARVAFDALDRPARDLLCRAAVLPEVHPEHLRDLVGEAWSPETFERLRVSVFLQAGERSGRYRLVDESIRDFLLERLADDVGPNGLAEWRRRAADVLLEHGEANPADAVDLLVTAADWGRLADVLDRRGVALVGREPARIEAALRAMPGAELWRRHHLVRLLAAACVARGRPDDAVEVYQRAERQDPSARSGPIAVEYQQALASLYERMGREDEAVACLRRAMMLRTQAVELPAFAGGDQLLHGLPPAGDHAERPDQGRLALAGARGSARAALVAGSAPRLIPRWAIPPRRLAAIAVVILAAVAWTLPPPDGLSVAGLRVLATVAGALALSLLRVLPEYLLGLLMISLWVVTGTLPVTVAAAGFSSSSWFLLLGSMAVGTAVAQSGLLYRGALEIVRRLPPSQTVFCLALTVLGVLFSPGMPNVLGRVTLAVPLAQDIADSLRYPDRSLGSAGLALAAYVGFGMFGPLFLTGSALCLILYGLFPPEVQAGITWSTWFLAALPTHLLLFGLTMLFLLVRYRPERKAGVREETLLLQRQVLGRLSRDEWSALLIVGLLLVGFSTQSLHGVDASWLAVAAVGLLFLTGALDDTAFREGVNWGFLLYLGLILGYGAIFSHVELDRWLGQNLQGLVTITAGSSTAFVIAVAVTAALLTFVLNGGPVAIVLSLALFPLAGSVGVSPWVLAITLLLTVNLWVFPQQSVLYLTAYYATGERAFTHAQARPLAFAYAAFVFLSLLASIPYWRWLGLMA